MKNKISLILLNLSLVLVFAFISCSKLETVPLTKFSKINEISQVSKNSAIAKARFMDVGKDITSYGHCWNVNPNPGIDDNKSSTQGIPPKQQDFTSELIDLIPNTEYHIRAFAITSSGTVYGETIKFTTLPDVNLPILTTSAPSSIGQSTAFSGGVITDDGGGSITIRGICWSTNINPTIDLESKTNNGTGSGSYSSQMTGLTPNTTYFVRAYATNIAGTSYGNQESFTTLSLINPPSVTTNIPELITQTTASAGGNVIDDGGDEVTFRGVCWSTSTNPTIELTTKTINGSGTGAFTSSLTGLSSNTKYYLRAYATNSSGTGYGDEVSFTTSSQVTDPDGNTYITVTIGSQTWFAENLKTTKFSDGTSIQFPGSDNTAWSNSSTGAYAWYNNDAPANKAIYGALYNWYAVDKTSNGNKNICPTGWHVPSDEEWKTLEKSLGMSQAEADNTLFRGTDEGSKLSGTASLWSNGLLESNAAFGTSGFIAKPAGYRGTPGSYGNLSYYAHFWTSDEASASTAWYRYIYNDNPRVARNFLNKYNGFSVRCIKD
jgi:uncharacterized protein (TIGR02145 family)